MRLESSFSDTSGNGLWPESGVVQRADEPRNRIENGPGKISGALLPAVLGLMRKSFGFREEMLMV